MRLLIISDIHGNYPALEAIEKRFALTSFDHIINCGDSTVYIPFANETLDWLQTHNVFSILGNTDKKVIKLLRGKNFKKPSKEEKRIMYSSTALSLTKKNSDYLCSLPKSRRIQFKLTSRGNMSERLYTGIYHGSPEHHHEFLFSNTPEERFSQLADRSKDRLILTGHSHTPYHKTINDIHFVNPGSVGRMFDGDPRASCAIAEADASHLTIRHYRVRYNIHKAVSRIVAEKLPDIYCSMLQQGKKLN